MRRAHGLRVLLTNADRTSQVAAVDDELNIFASERDLPSLTSQTAHCEFNPLTHFNSEDTAGGGADGGLLWITTDDPVSDREVERAPSNVAQRVFPGKSQLRGAFDACIRVAAVCGLAIVLNDQSIPLGQLVRGAVPTPPAVPAAPPRPRLKARAVVRSFAPLFQPPWTTDDRENPAVIPARYAMFSGIPNFRTALAVRPAPLPLLPTLPPRTIATVATILAAPLTTTLTGSPALASGPPPLHVPVTSTPLAPATLATPVQVATSQQAGDTGAIHTVLGQYRNAFSGLDSSAAKAVWPSVDVLALDRAFDRLEQQALEFAKCEIDVEGVRATASCDGSARYVPKVGDRSAQVATRHWRFNLRKVNQTWQIEEVDAR
jgi:hypothetical protein